MPSYGPFCVGIAERPFPGQPHLDDGWAVPEIPVMIRLVLVLLLAAGSARADLADEADLNAGLRVIAAGNFIRKACPDIEARRIRGIAYIRQLAGIALDRGYSEATIRAYIDDDDAKAVVEGQAMAHLRARGLGAGSTEDYCRVGRLEIAEGTTIGRLLRER